MFKTDPNNAFEYQYRGEATRLEIIDRSMLGFARTHQAIEMNYPCLIARSQLQRAEYDQAFPHLLMDVSSSMDAHPVAENKWCLSPAVCYHTYIQFANQIMEGTTIVTARGHCFRNEETVSPGRRQHEFQMREIVLLGSDSWIRKTMDGLRMRLDGIAASYGIHGDWTPANDPFFLPSAKGKLAIQKILKTKFEFQVDGLALASINYHGEFFGQRFNIRDANGEQIQTACLAIGLDRWLAKASCDQRGSRFRESGQ